MQVAGRTIGYAEVMSTGALFLALGGGAWAVQSQTSATTTTIRACAAKRTGALRILPKKGRCTRAERAVSWSQRGPSGAAGAPGAPGAAGGTGAAGRDGTDAQFTGAAAGGALAGSYPNPTLAAGAVTSNALAADAVTGEKLASGSVAGSDLAPLAVTTGALAAGAVTGAKVAANTLTGAQIDESTLGAVPALGTAGNSTQLAANGTAQTVVSIAGVGRAQASCNGSGQTATVSYTNLAGGGQIVTQVGQVQGGSPALTGTSLNAGATTTAFAAGASATQDRAVRVTYTAGPNGDGVPSSALVITVNVFTTWLGGGTCLAQAQAHRLG
jgi:hypothetical protein